MHDLLKQHRIYV